MKIKQHQDDFRVEELTDFQPGPAGDYSLYRLEKRGWTTPDAVLALRRRWSLDAGRVSFGGLKDRHAHTVQYLTVWRGPQRRLTHQGIAVEYLGQLAEPYQSQHIRANRFQLVLRALDAEETARGAVALDEMREDGVPNYFDDQRFGSAGGGEFMAKALVLGDFERALQLALTAPYEHDRTAQKKEKANLLAHWGAWPAAKAKLKPGHVRNLVDYLHRHPGDFRGAIARLRPELRGLYLSAYQSHLWNRMLARWLTEHLRPEQLLAVGSRQGVLPMHRQVDDGQRAALAALRLPLPTARGEADPADPSAELMRTILQEEGLVREQLKVKGLRDLFFSRGERAALYLPEELRHEAADDDLNIGRKKLTLRFALPRGCYATLLVKRIMHREDASISEAGQQ